VSIAVVPPAATLVVGTRLALQAIGTYSDGTTSDVTTQAAFTTSAPPVASVAVNVVTAVAPGTATISARLLGLVGNATITVSSARIVSIALTPASATTGIAGTVAFSAVATLSDGTHQDVTASATWSSTSVVTATLGAVSGSTTVIVTPAVLQAINVTPISSTLAVGGTVQLVATGVYSDMTTADLTASVTWSSSAAGVAFVSNAGGSQGL